MDQRLLKLIFAAVQPVLPAAGGTASLFAPKGGSQFVPVDQAFAFDFKQQGNQVTLNWQIRPGYYLYRQQIKLVPQQATLGAFTLPDGLSHKDEFFGEVAIFKQQLNLQVPLQQAAVNASLSVTYQGLRRGRLLLSAGNPNHPAGRGQRHRRRAALGLCAG